MRSVRLGRGEHYRKAMGIERSDGSEPRLLVRRSGAPHKVALAGHVAHSVVGVSLEAVSVHGYRVQRTTKHFVEERTGGGGGLDKAGATLD